MNAVLLRLGLLVLVSFLDVGRGQSWAASPDLLLAQQAAKKADFAKVVEILAPKVETLDRDGLFLLGTAYGHLKNPEAAIRSYTACLSKDPWDFAAKTEIGRELFGQGKEKEAITTLKEAIELNPKFIEAYRVGISVFEKRKNKYELRLLYQDLMANDGEKSEYNLKLCELTTLEYLYDLSKKYCDASIHQEPKRPEGFVYMGLTQRDTGDMPGAEVNLKRAADTFSKSLLAQLTYAQFLEAQKNYIEAFKYYTRAVAADQKSVPAQLGLGSSALEIQKYQESLAAFKAACPLDRTALPSLRRAIATLKAVKNNDWKKKFEELVDSCRGDVSN